MEVLDGQQEPQQGADLPPADFARAKSSLRLKYEAEAQVLRSRLGDLETIRGKIGLSQRKVCQLLLVDPSAWSRWTRKGEEPPPHVYRMLQWYLALHDKYPALDAAFWLSTVSRESHQTEREKADRLNELLQTDIQNLNQELTSLRESLSVSLTTAQKDVQEHIQKQIQQSIQELELRAGRSRHETFMSDRQKIRFLYFALFVALSLLGVLARAFFLRS